MSRPLLTLLAFLFAAALGFTQELGTGVISGEIVVQVEAILRALHYEIRYGVQVNGAAPSSWTSKVVTKVKPPVGFQGLTPGTVYAFQVRALGTVGYTAWTDSTTCMSM